jgi:hypothetical protein
LYALSTNLLYQCLYKLKPISTTKIKEQPTLIMSQVRRPSALLSSRVYIPSSPLLEPEGIITFNFELRAKSLNIL